MARVSTSSVELMLVLLGIVQIGVLAACILLWVHAAVRLRRCHPLVAPRATAFVPAWGLVDVCIVVSAWFLLMILLSGLVELSPNGAPPAVEQAGAERLDENSDGTISPEHYFRRLLVVVIAKAGAMAVGVAWIGLRYRSWMAALGLVGFRRSDFQLGLAAALMLIPGVLLIHGLLSLWIPYSHETLDLISARPAILLILMGFVAAVVIAPVTEEWFFRVLWQGFLQRAASEPRKRFELLLYGGFRQSWRGRLSAMNRPQNQGQFVKPGGTQAAGQFEQVSPLPTSIGDASTPQRWWPIVVASMTFGVAHLNHGAAPISLFLFSLGLGWLYQRTASIVPAIAVHSLLNLYSITVFTLVAAGSTF